MKLNTHPTEHDTMPASLRDAVSTPAQNAASTLPSPYTMLTSEDTTSATQTLVTTPTNPQAPVLPDDELLYELADLFKVFADTTRIKMLYALMGNDLCVADLAELIGASQSAVSHQLRILKQAHLVKFQRDGKNVIYSLSDDHVYTVLAQGMTHLCE